MVGHRVTWERERMHLRDPSWSLLWDVKDTTAGDKGAVLGGPALNTGPDLGSHMGLDGI